MIPEESLLLHSEVTFVFDVTLHKVQHFGAYSPVSRDILHQIQDISVKHPNWTHFSEIYCTPCNITCLYAPIWANMLHYVQRWLETAAVAGKKASPTPLRYALS